MSPIAPFHLAPKWPRSYSPRLQRRGSPERIPLCEPRLVAPSAPRSPGSSCPVQTTRAGSLAFSRLRSSVGGWCNAEAAWPRDGTTPAGHQGTPPCGPGRPGQWSFRGSAERATTWRAESGRQLAPSRRNQLPWRGPRGGYSLEFLPTRAPVRSGFKKILVLGRWRKC